MKRSAPGHDDRGRRGTENELTRNQHPMAMIYGEAQSYYTAGDLLPLPAGKKTPPPAGYTGHHGAPVTDVERAQWANHTGNYAWRVPDGVLGIDVDQYGDKAGLVTIAEREAELGHLPATYMSTGRDPGTGSGIRFYRYPGGRVGGVVGESVEVIQHGHRYAVVWPSVAAGSDGTPLEYRWYDPQGNVLSAPPTVDQLTELPEAWATWLASTASADRGPAAPDDVATALLTELVADVAPVCSAMERARDTALAKLEGAGEGGRHDAATAGVLLVVATSAEGHGGFSEAIGALQDAWDEAIGHDPSRAGEFARMVSTASAKVAADRPHKTHLDPVMHWCDRPAESESVNPHWYTRDEQSGRLLPLLPTMPPVFDPQGAYTDLELAKAAGRAIGAEYRWAHDVQGWLRRDAAELVWRLDASSKRDAAATAVSNLADRTPVGDQNQDKGMPGREQYDRRKRLQNSAGKNAVAQMLVDFIPNVRELRTDMDTLDLDPLVIWAGGVPWDLYTSQESARARVDIDPNTPHLATMGAYPEDVPTPMWDRLLHSVFPVKEQREWVMRLFGVATTGFPDAVLPILYGHAGTGKSSVMNLVMEALGSYAASPNSLLLDNTPNTTEEYGLLGKRLAFVDEGPRAGKLAVEKLKALTGGSRMTARPLFKNNVEWVPTHTLFMSSNDFPQVADVGLRRRVRAVHATGDKVEVRAAMLDILANPKAWRRELGGVAHQLIVEAARYVVDKDSANNPVSVEADLEALAREQDPFTAWMDERTRPGGPTLSMDLWDDFRAFADRVGAPKATTPNMTTWGRRLNELGYPPQHTRRGRVRGLELVHGGPVFVGPGATDFGAAVEVLEGAGVKGVKGFSDPSKIGETGPETTRPEGAGVKGVKGFSDPSKIVDNSVVGLRNSREGSEPNPSQTLHRPFTTLHTSEPKRYEGTDAKELPSTDAENLSEKCEGCEGFVKGLGQTLHTTNDVVNPQKNTKCEGCEGFDPLNSPKKKKVSKSEIGGRIGKNPSHPSHPSHPAGEGACVIKRSTGRVALPALLVRGSEPQALSMDDAAAWLGRLAGERVGLDVETSGAPIGHDDYQLKTAQLGNRSWAIVLEAEGEQLALAERTMDAAGELVAHAATADVSHMALACGRDSADWYAKTSDTMVLAAMTDPAITGAFDRLKPMGLKELTKHMVPNPVAPDADRARGRLFTANKWLTNTKDDTPKERNGWAMVPVDEATMVTYAASDVLDVTELRTLVSEPAPELLDRERRVHAIMARVTERGLQLDRDRVETMTAETTAKRDDAATMLRESYGVDNPASTQQVGAALQATGATLPLTAAGKPSTAADVVERLAAVEGPAQGVARALLEYREHDKLLSTYLTPYGIQCERGDGRMRPTILTMGAAATGRMSSMRPNIQQVPRPNHDEAAPGGGGGMRGVFVADEGHVFIAADFSSVEVRIAAAVTGDTTLAEMIHKGIDLHGEVVKLAWGIDKDHPDFGDVRYLAKRAVFGYLYGAGRKTMSKQLGRHGDKADAVVAALQAITPGLIQFDRQLRTAVENKTMRAWVHPSGRPGWFNPDMPHKSLNTVVQGYGRELLVDAVLRWEGVYPGCTVVPIHDELLIQVPEGEGAAMAEALGRCMTTDIPVAGTNMTVPIVSEVDAPTKRWGTVE